MTPLLEVGHVWVLLTVKAIEPINLAVVEEVGDDSGDVGSLDTGGDVLTVSTTIVVDVVSIDTAGSDAGGGRCEVIVPDKRAGGVVGAVNVVVSDDPLLVSGGLAGGGARGLSSSGRGSWRGGGGRAGGWGWCDARGWSDVGTGRDLERSFSGCSCGDGGNG